MTQPQTRARMALTYDDGTTEVVTVRPYGMVAAERHFGGEMPQVEGALYAIWSQMRAASNPRAGSDFETWMQSLDGIDQADSENPTVAAVVAD